MSRKTNYDYLYSLILNTNTTLLPFTLFPSILPSFFCQLLHERLTFDQIDHVKRRLATAVPH